jgi:hypothetical protein
VGEIIAGEPDLLLGRRTYEVFAGYWPNQNNAIAGAFNKATKYVVTRSLHQLDWKILIFPKRSYRGRGPSAEGIGGGRHCMFGALVNCCRC